MDIQLTCRHCELSDEVRKYAADKAERLSERFKTIHSLELVLETGGGSVKAEMIVGGVRGQRFAAQAKNGEMLRAIDHVIGKIEKQVSKFEARLQERHGKPASEEE